MPPNDPKLRACSSQLTIRILKSLESIIIRSTIKIGRVAGPVLIDVDEILIAPRRSDLALVTGGKSIAPPPWVDWLVWLGQWMRVQAELEGRRIAVVRLPSRRLAAAFVAIGSVFASARLHDESLDWDGLRSLAPGTKVFWRESASGKTVRRAGIAVGVNQIDGGDFLEVTVDARRTQQGKRFSPNLRRCPTG